MIYRRFGRTEINMPVFSCGGMRYQQSWTAGDKITDKSQANLERTIHRALEIGINHIETARGYGTSEEQLGQIMPSLPRESFIFQTKIGPTAKRKDFERDFEDSMKRLKLESVDLLGIHGINTTERLDWTLLKGGCLDAALEFKKQGRVGHVGFSTHGDLGIILNSIKDGRFDYVNLHWYYVNPFNRPAIEAAAQHDMGVFIISPNDKGGKLYEPSEKLLNLTAPLSPMVFNDLWCLSQTQVHTLSLGAARPTDFDEHLKALPYLDEPAKLLDTLRPITERLERELEQTLGREWVEKWHVGLPKWEQTPGEINIFEILRLRNLVKAFDMVAYGKMRYNLLGKGDHWFPGNTAGQVAQVDLGAALSASPLADRIPQALQEAHELMSGDEVKRLGSH